MRDSQRSRVYAWERSIPGLHQWRGTMSLEESDALVRRVWRKERGRYGLAKHPVPTVRAGRGGGSGGYGNISLGRWARQPVVVLHELAHCLTLPKRQFFREGFGAERRRAEAGHGPRFVGVAIGLYCRHLGCDRDELLAAAEEHGVRVDTRSIGTTPRFGWARRAVRALERLRGRAANETELAVEMGVGYRTVRGALLVLARQRRISRCGRKIVLLSH